jgi:hypothetical protein
MSLKTSQYEALFRRNQIDNTKRKNMLVLEIFLQRLSVKWPHFQHFFSISPRLLPAKSQKHGYRYGINLSFQCALSVAD